MTQWEWLVNTMQLNLADIVSLAAVIFSAVVVLRNRPLRVFRRERVRFLARLKIEGADRERIAPAEVRNWCDALASGRACTPAQEISWLTSQLWPTSRESEALTFFAAPEQLATIADSYRDYISRMDRGQLFGDTRAPLLTNDVAHCRGVVTLLETVPVQFGDPVELRDELRPGVTLTWLGFKKTVMDEDPTFGGPGEAVGVSVAYRRHRLGFLTAPDRLAPDQSFTQLPDDDGVRIDVEKEFQNPHTFDGIFPRLTNWKYGRCDASGHIVLHLSLAEVTYSAVTVDAYPRKYAKVAPRKATGEHARLLTLSGMVVTSDSQLVFTQRSRHTGIHKELIAASANGNLQIADRLGLVADLDPLGLPDPRGAIARECREELGVEVDASQVVLTGLARFSDEEERNSYLLVGLIPVDLTLSELRQRRAFADPLEGRWETDGPYRALPVPTTHDEVASAVRWLRETNDMTVHATAAGLAGLAHLLRRPELVVLRPSGSPIMWC